MLKRTAPHSDVSKPKPSLTRYTVSIPSKFMPLQTLQRKTYGVRYLRWCRCCLGSSFYVSKCQKNTITGCGMREGYVIFGLVYDGRLLPPAVP